MGNGILSAVIDEMHAEFREKNGCDPLYARCIIQDLDTGEEREAVVMLSEEADNGIDEYVDLRLGSVSELKDFTGEGRFEDFCITHLKSFEGKDYFSDGDLTAKQRQLVSQLENLLYELEANDVFIVHNPERGTLSAVNVSDYNDHCVLYDSNEIPNNTTDITEREYVMRCDIPHRAECDRILGVMDC